MSATWTRYRESGEVRPVLPRPPISRPRWLTGRLTRPDREALAVWGFAHVALFILAWVSAYVFRTGYSRGPLAPFQQWDAAWQQNIAAHGYFSSASLPHSVAFFPGFPFALAVAHLVLRNWVLSGLAVSGIAGCVAVVALSRLAGTSRAAVALVTMPAAVFLMTGYQESLFLAFAVPAWLAGRRGSWLAAGTLAFYAGLVRPDGVWLTLALTVMALTQNREVKQRLHDALVAAYGLLGPACWELYLWFKTGTPWAWPRAQQAGWGMHLAWPWSAWQETWEAAFGHRLSAADSFVFQVELAAFVTMFIAVVCFAVLRRWPECVLCGAAVIAVGTQTWYEGVSRTLLVLFPVIAAVAAWPERGNRGQMAWRLWLSVCGPLAVVFGLLYMSGQWAG